MITKSKSLKQPKGNVRISKPRMVSINNVRKVNNSNKKYALKKEYTSEAKKQRAL
ncbi:hypothetical protein [Clostridium sp. OS1-26]|uniref:hypothetical protein n=1 Tax=Clostridium sp. OS1-26 TaxID=3070681 RepID=UPI0027DF212B|nr:hypothetical protein [Clostridium sp. OS1-26]WML37167.1 hypothetical protein RCG18_11430 [Clostridium sp. OS1-26]